MDLSRTAGLVKRPYQILEISSLHRIGACGGHDPGQLHRRGRADPSCMRYPAMDVARPDGNNTRPRAAGQAGSSAPTATELSGVIEDVITHDDAAFWSILAVVEALDFAVGQLPTRKHRPLQAQLASVREDLLFD